MIDLIQAKADVSDFIAAYCAGVYCPAARRQAYIARAKGDACILAVPPRNEHARDAADMVNLGGDLIAFIDGLAASLDISTHSLAPEILKSLVGVNDAGRDMLFNARWKFRALARVA